MRNLPPALAAIQTEMTAFSAVPFPESCDGLTISGVFLEGLDGNLVACISSYVRHRGDLDDARHQVLRECLRDLERIHGELPEDATEYFDTLGRLGQQALSQLGG